MPKTPVTPQASAALLVSTRDGRVLIGERARTIQFLGSYLSFPGGRVEDDDRALAEKIAPNDPDATRKIAALRELEEEAGIMLVGGRALPLDGSDLDDRIRTAELERFVPAGHWITPEYAPVRYDTRMFLYLVDEVCEARPDAEFEWMRFESADDVMREWLDMAHLLAPPIRVALDVLRYGTEDAPRRLTSFPGARGDDHHEFEPIPDVRVYALRTPTLPPAETTNAVVIGRERVVVVDPATYDADERDKLLAFLEARTSSGATIDSVVLTHHHVDHVGSAKWLADTLDVDVVAHPITRDLVAEKIQVTRTIDEGDTIDLGLDARGEPFTLDVLHTPGHAPGHVVLIDRRPNARLAIVGDMVAAIGTIIIDPPEGDMAEYLQQLARLAAMPEMILIPAHGPPIVNGQRHLEMYIAHRLNREKKVLDALVAKAGGTPSELLDLAYADTSPKLYPLAARSCLAHLLKLVKDGKARQLGIRFEPTFG